MVGTWRRGGGSRAGTATPPTSVVTSASTGDGGSSGVAIAARHSAPERPAASPRRVLRESVSLLEAGGVRQAGGPQTPTQQDGTAVPRCPGPAAQGRQDATRSHQMPPGGRRGSGLGWNGGSASPTLSGLLTRMRGSNTGNRQNVKIATPGATQAPRRKQPRLARRPCTRASARAAPGAPPAGRSARSCAPRSTEGARGPRGCWRARWRSSLHRCQH